MAELKTKATKENVQKFLNKISDPERRQDCLAIARMLEIVTKQKPVMWGSSIVGFGTYHYKSERSTQEGDWMLIGFSPRKQNITIYIMPGFKSFKPLMKKLGKYKTGGSCLYIKKLSDIDSGVLQKLVSKSFVYMTKKYAQHT